MQHTLSQSNARESKREKLTRPFITETKFNYKRNKDMKLELEIIIRNIRTKHHTHVTYILFCS